MHCNQSECKSYFTARPVNSDVARLIIEKSSTPISLASSSTATTPASSQTETTVPAQLITAASSEDFIFTFSQSDEIPAQQPTSTDVSVVADTTNTNE